MEVEAARGRDQAEEEPKPEEGPLQGDHAGSGRNDLDRTEEGNKGEAPGHREQIPCGSQVLSRQAVTKPRAKVRYSSR